ncbi:MAG: dihydropteroate synthase [Litoreibacter sp.]|nr:dihydropteroate synthase [Litoreibacter sp.]
MTLYHRPIAQTDAARPKGALPLAGGPIWFDRVERIERNGPRAIMPAQELPDDVTERLIAPRADIAGLSMARPQLMGVLNLTPDSFSDGGVFNAPDIAVERARAITAEGASILDLGGESTRPGAETVPVDAEIERTVPIIRALRDSGHEVPISIDTRKAPVARAALEAGATILNDVSAFSFDPDMARVAAQTGAPICLMHAQGDPATMQDDPVYDDVLLDVYDFLQARLERALAAGVDRSQIILDPGIGFGKTVAHNLALIRGLSLFHGLGCPILLGVSRKRFIGTLADVPEASARAPGSVAVGLEGLRQGVQILRAHDIKEHRQAMLLWQAILDNQQ